MKRTTGHITTALCIVALLLLAGCASAIAEEPPTARYETTFWQVRDADEPEGAVRIVKEMEEREVAAEEAARADETAYEAALDEEWYYESQEWYSEPYSGFGNDYGNPFKQDGVRYEGDTTYTWYSQNVRSGGGLDELNANGRHVDDGTGFIVDEDGYIAVASSDHAQGEVIDTPWGAAKVYDSGCDSGVVDVYTDF